MLQQNVSEILVLDREPELHEMVSAAGHRVSWIRDPLSWAGRGALEPADLTLLDIDIGPANAGLELCNSLTGTWPDTPVVAVTARTDLAPAVGAIRSGAYDLLTRPVTEAQVARALERALRHRQLRRRLELLTETADQLTGLDELIGTSPAMRALYSAISRAAQSHLSVVITGESGTGKELVARTLHQRSRRRDQPFVGVNCSAIPANLLESELFGHVEGAFTGARGTRAGLFARADRGTLFLDEIGEMPVALQAKLLRALQEQVVRPVGGDHERPVDVRLLAATNRDLAQEIAAGRFREDLYYRLAGVELRVPPLRERGNDALHLAEHFLHLTAARHNKQVARPSAAAARAILGYDWPGNVRELQNAIERAVALCRGPELEVSDLPELVSRRRAHRWSDRNPETIPSLRELRTSYIDEVLAAVDGNRSRAARILGLNRRTLYRHLKRAESAASATKE